MDMTFFGRQLASYAAVHRDGRNKATHCVGIPVIVFSLLLIFALWPVRIAGTGTSMAALLAIVAVAGWMTLDLGIGVLMAVLMLAAWYAAEAFARTLGTSATWIAFVALFVGGWALQFLGHHYEGKRPALIDNLFQGFIGPMFLVAEALVAIGRRPDLARLMAHTDAPVTGR